MRRHIHFHVYKKRFFENIDNENGIKLQKALKTYVVQNKKNRAERPVSVENESRMKVRTISPLCIAKRILYQLPHTYIPKFVFIVRQLSQRSLYTFGNQKIVRKNLLQRKHKNTASKMSKIYFDDSFIKKVCGYMKEKKPISLSSYETFLLPPRNS